MIRNIKAPPMIEKYWEKFYKANDYQQKQYTDEAVKWFKNRVSKDVRVKANKIIDVDSDYKKRTAKQQAKLNFGSLYTFEYEAETPGHEAGFYDRFPMVFFFNSFTSKDNKLILLGLNVHYLTPNERAALYKALMTTKNIKNINSQTRLRLEWDIIISLAGSTIGNKAIHAYRADRFRSQIIDISPEDWIIAVFLRSELFVKPVSHDPVTQSFARKLLRR